ncbi:MAG: hypothetical protein ACTTKU_04970 [Eggerthia catenaformis]|uniref:hypothetical protein n=1 Tax=Eggerthia catenaformis TaxID=31973 RepID=UPI003F9F5CF4
MKILSATLISNTISLKNIPTSCEDAQQILSFSSNGDVSLQRYIFDHKLIKNKEESTHIDHIDELFNFIVSGFTKTVPISATLINDQWELILNTDEGYQWYNGSLDGGPLVNNKNFSRYLKELLPFDHLIAFG